MDFTIVRATRDHLDLVAPLFDAYRQSYGQSPDPDAARAFLRERIEQGESVVFLALRDGAGCGFTQLFPAFSSVALRPIWILNDLFVAPEARRRGLGQRLLQIAVGFAAESGAARLELGTAVDNHSAQSLYEANGWTRDEGFLHYSYRL